MRARTGRHGVVLVVGLVACGCASEHAAQPGSSGPEVAIAADAANAGAPNADLAREIPAALLDLEERRTSAYGPGWGDFKTPRWARRATTSRDDPRLRTMRDQTGVYGPGWGDWKGPRHGK